MADDEVVDENSEDVDDVEGDGEDEVFDEELDEVVDDAEEDEEEADDEDAKAKAKGEDVAEDDDEADPDDVEEDLDTILRDRIAAGADEDDEDEDEEEDASDQPKRNDGPAKPAEEFSCPECFLMVRRSQFSVRRTDCPGGLDGEDCPMKQRFI